MNTNNAELLSAALTGLLIQKSKLEDQIAVIQNALKGRPLASVTDNTPVKATAKSSHRGRKTMSPAARKRIAEAQKKRWAKYRKEQKANAAKAAE